MKFHPVYEDEWVKSRGNGGAAPVTAAGTSGASVRGMTDARGAFDTRQEWATFTVCPTVKWSSDLKASIQNTKILGIFWNVS